MPSYAVRKASRIINSYFAAYLKRSATTSELNQFIWLVSSQTLGLAAAVQNLT